VRLGGVRVPLGAQKLKDRFGGLLVFASVV
jgi:hypothetical protein